MQQRSTNKEINGTMIRTIVRDLFCPFPAKVRDNFMNILVNIEVFVPNRNMKKKKKIVNFFLTMATQSKFISYVIELRSLSIWSGTRDLFLSNI